MGLLDDLKRQADALQARHQTDSATLQRHTTLVEGACTTAFRYWLELAKQLNVLQPPSPVRYVLDSRHVLERLPMGDFRVDARRQSTVGTPLHEHVQLFCQLKSGRALVLRRDFPTEIQKLEERLRLAGVEFQAENVRDAETGRYQHTRFEFTADLHAGIKLLPRHDSGQVQFQLLNLEGFETSVVELPAFEVGQASLDELTKLVLGQPHRFYQLGRLLRRG
ncbi:hypothetical protein OOT46_12985 [Aquabacterium sp. A7-Y]|uniref:hypothetical protein n=1 Tax=Aquabacterium sp. A7-Y TaxID=1349605 RepID=UPI00223E20B8|nr:hypothetical protein [Aquabacterium sp. A7-Y]MCW7538756.1 hypothetical protein [Aquabacterium sp. A7-Y]